MRWLTKKGFSKSQSDWNARNQSQFMICILISSSVRVMSWWPLVTGGLESGVQLGLLHRRTCRPRGWHGAQLERECPVSHKWSRKIVCVMSSWPAAALGAATGVGSINSKYRHSHVRAATFVQTEQVQKWAPNLAILVSLRPKKPKTK